MHGDAAGGRIYPAFTQIAVAGNWGARNRTRTWWTKTTRAAVTPLPRTSSKTASTTLSEQPTQTPT